LGVPHKKRKEKRKYKKIKKKLLRENQKYIQVRRGYQSDQKIAKDWLRRIKNTKIKI
jgi:hypothetical protein